MSNPETPAKSQKAQKPSRQTIAFYHKPHKSQLKPQKWAKKEKSLQRKDFPKF